MLVSSGKMKFRHFWPFPEKSFWLPLDESTIAPLGKDPSDAHGRKVKYSNKILRFLKLRWKTGRFL